MFLKKRRQNELCPHFISVEINNDKFMFRKNETFLKKSQAQANPDPLSHKQLPNLYVIWDLTQQISVSAFNLCSAIKKPESH